MMLEILRNMIAWVGKNPWVPLVGLVALLIAGPTWLKSTVQQFDSLVPDKRAELHETLDALDHAFGRYTVVRAGLEHGQESDPAGAGSAGEADQEEPLPGTAESDSPEEGDVKFGEFSETVVVTRPGENRSSALEVNEIVVDLGLAVVGDENGGVKSIKVASWGAPGPVWDGPRVRITYRSIAGESGVGCTGEWGHPGCSREDKPGEEKGPAGTPDSGSPQPGRSCRASAE